MRQIKELIFGQRIEGQKLIPPKPLPHPRPLNQKDYERWCRELNVTLLYDRKIVYL